MKKGSGIAAAGGLVAGAVAANFVSKQATNMFPAIGKYSGAVPLVVGWLLAGMKAPLAKAAGAGMVAVGGANLIGSFVPQVAAPVSDQVITDAVIDEDLSADLDSLEGYAADEQYIHGEEDLTEDLSEEM
jgi:cystathionine beta-lyase family protein involved in aluminum resistance